LNPCHSEPLYIPAIPNHFSGEEFAVPFNLEEQIDSWWDIAGG